MRTVLSMLTLLAAFAAAPVVAQSTAPTRAVLADASRVPARATIIDGAN